MSRVKTAHLIAQTHEVPATLFNFFKLPLLLLFLVSNPAYGQNPVGAEELTSAQALLRQGKFHDAAAAYRAVLDENNASVSAYAGLVESYLKAEDVAAADEASGRAIMAIPKSGLVHAVRGDVYFRQGRLAEAEKEYRTGLELDHDCARALLGMGRIYSAVSDDEAAEERFARAHELDPDDGDALYHWAVLLPYPQSVKELERHLSAYHSSAEEEQREREFIELVRGVGDRETWVGPKEIKETEIRLEQLVPRPGTVIGLGVRVKFSGKASATLLLDTGSSWMTIPRKLAEKIGARRISDYAIRGVGDSKPANGYFAWVDKIAIGELEFHDCVVHVATQDSIAGTDGVIGTNIFAKYFVTVDFPAHKLILSPLPGQSPPGDNHDPQTLTQGGAGRVFSFGHMLLLKTLVNNSASGLFLVDTGSNVSSISPQLAERVGQLHPSKDTVTGMSGRVNNLSFAQDIALMFSKVAEPKRDLAAFDPHSLSGQLGTEVSGFIGFDLLSQMQIKINYRDGTIEFDQGRR